MMKLIKFGAEWCNPCRVMDAKLKTFTACPVEKYNVDDADTDEHVAALLEKYSIRNIPVCILLNDETDEVVKKWVGAFDLKEVIDELG